MKTKGFQKATQTFSKVISENSPTILSGASVAGLLSTTIMAVKATPRALEMLENDRLYREKNNHAPIKKMEIVKLTWQYYVPAALMGVVTIGCIVGANSINLRRNAALASIYSLTETTLKEYQAKVVETIGETKERKIKDEVVKDKLKENPVKESEVILTGKGETLCYDTISGRYFKSDIEKIRRAENELNRDLLNEDFISLNDVYYSLGLSNTKMGDEVGWHICDGMLAFTFTSQLNDEGVPCLVLDYPLTPRYDYLDKGWH